MKKNGRGKQQCLPRERTKVPLLAYLLLLPNCHENTRDYNEDCSLTVIWKVEWLWSIWWSLWFIIHNSSFIIFLIAHQRIVGGYSERVPPLPIPNREVKPLSADGTAVRWESRSLPTQYNTKPHPFIRVGLSCLCPSLNGQSNHKRRNILRSYPTEESSSFKMYWV